FLFTNDKKSSDQKPIIDQLVIPLNILSKTVGLMVLFFKVKPKFKKHQSSPVNTIIENVIQTIERLRILVSSEYSRFSNLINSMSNGVIMFDLNNKILLANPVAEQIANSKQEDLTLDNFLGLIHKVKKTFTDEIGIRAEKEEIDMKKVIDAVIRNNEPVVFQEVTINDRTFEVSITPTRDFKREIAGGAILLHDITHLKEISELKTEFVSLASHQLRTPLTSIRLFTEMLLDEAVGPINSDQKEYINNMYKSTINMIELVNNLLNLSRIESGKLKINYEPVDLEGFMVDLIKEAMVLAEEKKCKLEFIKPKKKFEKQIIDSNLLRQVVHNLITNAIRYSEDGKGVIIVTLAKKDDSILIDVTDNGIGIPQSIQTRIFDKFFRADNAVKAVTEGSGLGLYIAKIIMQGFNGKIWFDSKDGQHGTTFHVKFPCKLV
ncbi:MAG: ATP-binding protein, partial [Candidatus Falkowbacteria bacterium]|nr:ATP-binding protein [Candidatus Falkowbacteria bacterium]